MRIHWSFFLLVLLMGAWVGRTYGWAEAGWWALTVLFLFLSVLLHEMGHSLAAVALGYGVRDITLLPIGGVARMERMTRDPYEELLITAAGPLVNFCIALSLALPIGLGWAEFHPVEMTGPHLVSNLLWLNLVLGLFNLLPAFPMDGGRVVRALLGIIMGRAWATRIAAVVGQGLALLMMAVGLFLNWWLILIGVFVFLAARSEGRAVAMEERIRGLKVGDVAVGHPAVLRPEAGLWEAAAMARSSFQQDFPVVDSDGLLIGLLDRTALARGLREAGGGGSVGGAARPGLSATPDEELEWAYRRMGSAGCGALAVVDSWRRVIGLLSVEQVRKALAFGGGGARSGAGWGAATEGPRGNERIGGEETRVSWSEV